MSDPIYTQASKRWEEPEEHDQDFLDDKPKGFCPWDGKALQSWTLDVDDDGTEEEMYDRCFCQDWYPFETEEENRQLYVKEKKAEHKHEARIAEEVKKLGVDEP